MNFTVEVVVPPVLNDDWGRLREMTDVIPGTLLLEDPEAPMLIFPVDADGHQQAASFVDGVCTVAEIRLVSGCVYPTPDVDFELGEGVEAPAASVRKHRWEDSQGRGCEARLVSQ